MKNQANTVSIEEIRAKMLPVSSPEHCHTALYDPNEGTHSIKHAAIRLAGGAKQVTLTQWELPPDAVGRIYTVDVFIGKVVDIKYTDWSKNVRRGAYEYAETSNKKGNYLTFPQVQFQNITTPKTDKKKHSRPFVHEIVAYVYPALREQYAQAILRDMQQNNRSYEDANVQINHMDKDTYNNSILNLEAVTGSENGLHKKKTTKGTAYSMVCDRKDHTVPADLLSYDRCGVAETKKSYLDKLCTQLSSLNLDPDCLYIDIQTVSGKRRNVFIGGMTAWGILEALYLAHTYNIVGESHFQ